MVPAISRVMSADRRVLEEFGAAVRARFGPRLRELALFGSRARGEGSEESDSTCWSSSTN
jgi:predicted nucleotidyltransferase